eukprot:Hpha_TRINITY_DN14308_c0_g1::TRINITY_DN14308_c0_g1_i1::g.86576::m.86576
MAEEGGGEAKRSSITDGVLKEVMFNVPLLRREHQLKFFLGRTVREQEGCIKTKLAHDEQGNEFHMRLVLRDRLDEQEDAPAIEDAINTELAVMKLLDQKNCTKLFQVLSTDDIVYVLTERCETTLEDKIEAGLPSHEDAKRWFCELLDGVIYLHSRGLAHRTISPSKVYFDGDESVKLDGFGCAVLSDCEELVTDRPAVLADSPYVAPEILARPLGEQEGTPYDAQQSDIYSLGATLHCLLTGKPPPASSSPSEPPEPDPAFPEDLKDILQLALSPDPQKRPCGRDMKASMYVFGMGPLLSPDGATRGAVVLTTVESPRVNRNEMRRSFNKMHSGLQLNSRRLSRQSSICDDASQRSDLASPMAGHRPKIESAFLLSPGDAPLEPDLQLRSAPEFSLSPTGGVARSRMKRNLEVDIFAGGGGGAQKKKAAGGDVDGVYDNVVCDFVASPMAAKGKKRFEVGAPVEQAAPASTEVQSEYLKKHNVACVIEGALAIVLRERPANAREALASYLATPRAPLTGPPPEQALAVAYLREHNLPGVIANSLTQLLAARPPDPLPFLAACVGQPNGVGS